MSKPERLLFTVTDNNGTIAPENSYVMGRMRSRGYRKGDILLIVATKPRKPGYHRYAHKIGQFLIVNTERFESYVDAHEVIKTLQVEGEIACDTLLIKAPNNAMYRHLVPKSLAFDRMDQGEFEEVVKALCRYISYEYFPTMDGGAVQKMIELMPDE